MFVYNYFSKTKILSSSYLHPTYIVSFQRQTKVFTSLCIIGGIDSRIRVGGLVHHEKYGDGTCVDILPNGKILLYFGNSIKPKTCHLSKLDVVCYPLLYLFIEIEFSIGLFESVLFTMNCLIRSRIKIQLSASDTS